MRRPRDPASVEVDGATPAGEFEGCRAILLARSEPNLPSERISGYHGPGPWSIVSQATVPCLAGTGRREPDTMPFALLAILLALAVVAVLVAIFFLVRRWL